MQHLWRERLAGKDRESGSNGKVIHAFGYFGKVRLQISGSHPILRGLDLTPAAIGQYSFVVWSAGYGRNSMLGHYAEEHNSGSSDAVGGEMRIPIPLDMAGRWVSYTREAPLSGFT